MAKKNNAEENKIKYEELKVFQLLTNSKFYYSLIFPIINLFMVIISKDKIQIAVFSTFFGLSLLPLLKTFIEVFKYSNDEN